MINNRPKVLESIPFYNHLPRAEFAVDFSTLPSALKFDIFDLCGLSPVTIDVSNLCPDGIWIQPSEVVIDYYCSKNIKFQMILVVANVYGLKFEGDILTGKPYNISLVPTSANGIIDEVDARYASHFPLENIQGFGSAYFDFDPFSAGYSFYAKYGSLMGTDGLDIYTDSIGFVVNGYFLATTYNKNDVLLPNVLTASHYIQDKYTQFRLNHYFKKFTNLLPRKMWGADSPIELFLIQALAAKNLYPQIQTLIFKNGEIFPSFYEMISPNTSSENHEVLTEVDLFFPEKKIAVFCDSNRHHRSLKSKEKDKRISTELEKMGIKSIRIDGQEIVHSLEKSVEKIEGVLAETEG